MEATAWGEHAINVIGTPDDLVARIRELQELTGGFGAIIGFVHDWANREDMLRSYDLIARYVIPETNGMLEGYRESNRFVIDHRDVWNRAGAAIMSKIAENKRAAAAMKVEDPRRPAFIADVSATMDKEQAEEATATDGD